MSLSVDVNAHGLVEAVTRYWNNTDWSNADENGTDSSDETEENIEALHDHRVRDTLLSLHELDDNPDNWSLSSRAAVNWLHRLGYNYKQVKKGLYYDGHEDPEVIEYRQQIFLLILDELKPKMVQWNEKDE